MRRGEMLPSRRVDPDELSLGPRVLCRCGTSLRRRVNRQRGACALCYDGTDAAVSPPAGTVRATTTKAHEGWTLARVAEAMRVLADADMCDDLAAVVGVPYQQLTTAAGRAMTYAAARGDKALAAALHGLRQEMFRRSKARRARWVKPQRMTIVQNEEA